jgi:hypothetical protein
MRRPVTRSKKQYVQSIKSPAKLLAAKVAGAKGAPYFGFVERMLATRVSGRQTPSIGFMKSNWTAIVCKFTGTKTLRIMRIVADGAQGIKQAHDQRFIRLLRIRACHYTSMLLGFRALRRRPARALRFAAVNREAITANNRRGSSSIGDASAVRL